MGPSKTSSQERKRKLGLFGLWRHNEHFFLHSKSQMSQAPGPGRLIPSQPGFPSCSPLPPQPVRLMWAGGREAVGRGFPVLDGLLPSPWALSTCTCVLNAKYAPLLKMQEMSLLFQKENEPKQKKNQQAPGLSVYNLQCSGGEAPSFQLVPPKYFFKWEVSLLGERRHVGVHVSCVVLA